MARKVILDVDTGSDDAIATIMAALSPEIDLLGVVAVNGNQPLKNTLENTLRVIQMLGLENSVPVVKGCDKPMVKSLLPGRAHNPHTPPFVRDENGNFVRGYHPPYLNLPESKFEPVKENFITWYINTIKNSPEKVTLIPVGPLTNVGMLLRAEPDIIENIEEIIIMGGGHEQRNHTAASEFNINMDPEAAQIVLTSGAKVTLVPLDATHKASSLDYEDAKVFKDMNNVVGDLVYDLIINRIEMYNALQPLHKPDIAPIHDALCVAYAINKDVLKDMMFTRVNVDISGGFADGQTIIDTRHFHNEPDNCYVALDGDKDLFTEMLISACKRFKA